MIKRVLKNKLVALGYAATYVENKMKEFNSNIDTSKYTESDLIQKIKVLVYDKPTAEIPRFFLNVKGELVEKFLFDGRLSTLTKFSVIGSQISLLDYPLTEKLCIIGLTEKLDILILLYNPSRETSNRYAYKSYEDIYAEERESIVSDYMEALTAGDRLTNSRAKDIIYILLTEFIIDNILIENSNPKIKLYDNAIKFAENITNYEFKYINRRINRIEFVEKYITTKYIGFGVKIGNVTNDPYVLLKDANSVPDFYLNRPTFVWLVSNNRGQEEIAIYTANEVYEQSTYRDLFEARKDIELAAVAEMLTSQFSNEMGYVISENYILSVLKKLNKELLILPIDFIRNHTSENYEYIEPLKYRFSIMKNKKDFESMLYNSIEDNLNGRYRYRFVEKLSGIYMTIGNKLNYTDPNGKFIRKQSVADFNINFNAAIIKRETLIDERSIPQLMGYMYKDLDNSGTDMLPVPSIEVVFYFPEADALGQEVEMYNGTEVEIAKGDGTTSFYDIDANRMQYGVQSRPKNPNEKYVLVKYVNSNGDILKENIIRDVMVGTTYVPELIPVINDREGREWSCEPNQLLSLIVSADNSKNEIEVKYVKKMARVVINYINKQGSEINRPVIKNMQVGEIYDMASAKKYIDASDFEWNLYQSKPSKFIVSDEESANILTLVYDVIKADVFVYYQTRSGKTLKNTEKIVTVANKEFSPQVPEKINDDNGLVWKYAQDSKSIIYVEENEINAITLKYDELKKRVITRFVDEKGQKIKDDIVEIIQVGKEIPVTYEPIYKDIYNKMWKFNKANKEIIKVSENEQENIFTITYDKMLTKVFISLINEMGQRIKDDMIEKAQIGSNYMPHTIKEVEDNLGKYWICVESEKNLYVDEDEVKNKISYMYKPFMTKVYMQYVDIEGNELLPQKEKEVQVGSIVIPDFIKSLQGKDQRSWILSDKNINEFRAKKHKEENIIKINYDKKVVDITLIFKDIRGNVLKTDSTQKAQLGSEFKVGIFEKITSENGEKWMISRTEPAKMFVREDSKFLLIYDEIKAKVVIKCVNISDSKSIVDDIEYITKLGGVYVPNISQKIVDKIKRRWTYVGEPGMSIITKENEQENIITLKYEPDKANVTIKYLNKNQQMIHKDVISQEQIGSEVAIKEYQKIFEENGLGWKLKNMSRNTLIVDEEESKNIVLCNYEPLIVPVTTRYIDEEINEIFPSKIDNIQVGQKFNATILPKITDSSGKLWVYSNIKTTELIVKDEDNNKVNIKYLPLKKSVTEKFMNLNNEELSKEKISSIQVGEIYTLIKQDRVIDSEDRSWIYQKSTAEKIKVLEEEEKNVIINYYEKELTKVTIKYQTNEGKALANDKIIDLQIGSIYSIEPKEILEDAEKLYWKISKENKLKVKISRNSTENVFIVIYEKYMVNVYDKYINEANNTEIIKPTVSKAQVGSSYLVKVKDSIVDGDGKHWVQASKSDVKIFTSNYKVEPITISKEEARNVTVVKYKPKLIETIIKYQDSLGREIKTEEVKKLQIGSMFSENIPKKLVDNMGNKWTYNPHSNSNIKITENPKDNIVVLAYEEQKGTVTFKYFDKNKNELQASTTKLIQIGNVYVPQFETILTDSNGCVWEYSERDKEKIEVKENDAENIIELIYIPLNVNVEITYVDLWGNEITSKKLMPAQLGSKYKPNIKGNYTNEKSLLYKIVKMEPEAIVVQEIPITEKNNPNKFKLTFEPVNSNIVIKFQDLDGNLLKDDEKISLQVGSKYKPEPIEFIKDKKGNQWQLVNAKSDEITVLENENENIIKYVYEVAKADIIIRFLNVDGLNIQSDIHLSQQVGSEYVPTPEPYILDKENKKWKLLRVQPVNLKVGSINNIVTVTYQEAKANVVWQYCDERGNKLKADERFDAQIGTRYTPIVSNKVIYDASQIWRLLKIEPYEIIISENSNENIIKLIYSNTKIEEKEEKKERINPFTNTVIPTEVDNKDKASDKNNNQILNSNQNTINLEIENNKTQETVVEETFEFNDEYLKKLSRSMSLTNNEKIAINKLNDINTEFVKELQKAKTAYYQGQSSYDYTEAENYIVKEKELIKENLEKLISKDLSGARMLKIFEHITASEINENTYGKLQQRRAVLVTDYFLEKPLEDMDKIIYICERGKNNIEIELINNKLSRRLIKNEQEAFELKARLYFEKLLLDNYYKARNNSNDNYFSDPDIKATMLPDIVVGVTNLLVRQALNVLRKEVIDLSLSNELEAIISLCTPQQISSIKIEIDKFDGKQKRNANKMLQEIMRNK